MNHDWKPVQAIAFGALVFWLFFGFWGAHQRNPYYFSYDMDHITVLDSLLIQSRQFPDYIGHPGLGMHLILKATGKAAHSLHQLSVLTLEDLRNSLSPLSAIAETTDFARAHSPWIAIGIVLSLWVGVCLAFRLAFLPSLGLLLFFGVSEALTYQAGIIRSELYSLLFWSLAFCALSAGSRFRRESSLFASLALAGVFMGLSYATKVQAFLPIVLLPLVFLFLVLRSENRSGNKSIQTNRRVYAHLAVSVVNLLAFSTLYFTARGIVIPEGFATFTPAKMFRLNVPAASLWFLLITIPLVQGFLLRRKEHLGLAFRVSSYLSVIFLGFHLSLLFHFAVFSDAAQAFQYLLYNFKIMFIRWPYAAYERQRFLIPVQRIIAQFVTNPEILIAHVGLLLGLVVRRKSKASRVALLMTSIAFINIFLGTRSGDLSQHLEATVLDILWIEIPFKVLSAVYFLTWMEKTNSVTTRHCIKVLGFFILFWTASAQQNLAYRILPLQELITRVNQNAWFTHIYDGNQKLYSSLMTERYPPSNAAAKQIAAAFSIHHREIRRIASLIFPDLILTYAHIGPLAVGLPVSRNSMNQRAIAIPQSLEGAFIVDPSHADWTDSMISRGILLKESPLPPPTDRLFPIIRRDDLQIWFFKDSENNYHPSHCQLGPEKSHIIRLESQGNWEGQEILGNCLVSIDEIRSNSVFFVVKRGLPLISKPF